MNIKETRQLIPSGLGGFTKQTRVIELAEGETVPEGAEATTDELHDWQEEK